ncbi:hypothetical protein BaRGS_00026274 [Batillaria attramentaria]|uniref:Uncharacterized protein n=1 Tax=Batillaria attramentaria TaxID=370345 RepID=A0ABD0K5V0_9CAEN
MLRASTGLCQTCSAEDKMTDTQHGHSFHGAAKATRPLNASSACSYSNDDVGASNFISQFKAKPTIERIENLSSRGAVIIGLITRPSPCRPVAIFIRTCHVYCSSSAE